MRDIAVTWPKSRPLSSYLAEMLYARRHNMVINYRSHNIAPLRDKLSIPGARCYRIHDGHVRGYTNIVGIMKREAGEVARVKADPKMGHWPPGWYVVCEPVWHEIRRGALTTMRGSQGWRWFDREALDA